MERRDYLISEAERFGQVLGKLLLDWLGLKSQGKISIGIEITNQTLKNELDLDIDKILTLSTDELMNILTKRKGFTSKELELFSDILLELAESSPPDKKIQLKEKSLAIYQYLEETDNTYSYDRHLKIEKLINI